MSHTFFLIMFLFINIDILPLDHKSLPKTPQNSPELYAKILRHKSFMTGCDKVVLAKVFHDQIVDDMNNPKVTDIVDFELDLIAFGLYDEKKS